MYERYQSEMLYLLTKRYYNGLKSPGEYRQLLTARRPQHEKSAREIINDLVKKLAGE